MCKSEKDDSARRLHEGDKRFVRSKPWRGAVDLGGSTGMGDPSRSRHVTCWRLQGVVWSTQGLGTRTFVLLQIEGIRLISVL